MKRMLGIYAESFTIGAESRPKPRRVFDKRDGLEQDDAEQ